MTPDFLTIARLRSDVLFQDEAARMAYYADCETAADHYGDRNAGRDAHYARAYIGCVAGAIADADRLRRNHASALDLLTLARYRTAAAFAKAAAEPGEPVFYEPMGLLTGGRCHTLPAPQPGAPNLMQPDWRPSTPPPLVIAVAALAQALPDPWRPPPPASWRECVVGAVHDDGSECPCFIQRRPHSEPEYSGNVVTAYAHCAATTDLDLLAMYDRAMEALFAPAYDGFDFRSMPPYQPQTNPGGPWTPAVNTDHPNTLAVNRIWDAYREARYCPAPPPRRTSDPPSPAAPPWSDFDLTPPAWPQRSRTDSKPEPIC